MAEERQEGEEKEGERKTGAKLTYLFHVLLRNNKENIATNDIDIIVQYD